MSVWVVVEEVGWGRLPYYSLGFKGIMLFFSVKDGDIELININSSASVASPFFF